MGIGRMLFVAFKAGGIRITRTIIEVYIIIVEKPMFQVHINLPGENNYHGEHLHCMKSCYFMFSIIVYRKNAN